MSIDEPGQQGRVTQIDDLGASWNGRPSSDSGDPPARYNHQTGRKRRFVLAVEQPSGLEDVRLVGRFLSLSVALCPQNCSAEKHKQDTSAHDSLASLARVSRRQTVSRSAKCQGE